jgi:hypothetical protein
MLPVESEEFGVFFEGRGGHLAISKADGGMLLDPGRQIKAALLPLDDRVGVKVDVHGSGGRSRLRINFMPRSISAANSRCSFSLMILRASRKRRGQRRTLERLRFFGLTFQHCQHFLAKRAMVCLRSSF